MRAGASLVIELRPTGLRHNSPIVWMRYTRNSQLTPTFAPVSAVWAAGTRITKPRPTQTSPKANFDGLAGWFLPHFTHSHANRGARMKIRIAFTDCHQLLGNA